MAKALSQATGLRPDFLVDHLPRMGVVHLELPNGQRLRLLSRGDDWIPNQVFWHGWDGYEPETVPLFFRLASTARITLDVGAHVGLYSLLAACANHYGQVYAFEPLGSNCERLKQNVHLNELTNVLCLQKAVGETDETAEFYHGTSGAPLSNSLSPRLLRFDPNMNCSTVQVITVDRFVRERKLEGVDLIKIDTETTELQVLKGMAETLKRDRTNIICEVWGGPRNMFDELLRPLGYKYYSLTKDGPIEYTGENISQNYLFTTHDIDRLVEG